MPGSSSISSGGPAPAGSARGLISDTPLVDRAGLAQLGSMVPSERLVTWITASIADAERSCQVMATLPAGSEELAREAHTLCGTSAIMRLMRISQLTREIELNSRSGSGVESLVSELKELVAATAAELRRLGLMAG
jgi:HPt (histidine-containing phosphotransfer) domain-containing protein